MRPTHVVSLLVVLAGATAVVSGTTGPAVVGSSIQVDDTAGIEEVANETADDPPLAEAGLDRAVLQGVAVALDAGGSHDPDGTITDYRWTVTTPNGTTVTPECPTCRRTTFRAGRLGQYEVTLTVRDDDGATATDTLYVTVTAGEGPQVGVKGPAVTTAGESRRFVANVTPGDLRVDRVVWTVDGRVVANRSGDAPRRDSLRVTFDTTAVHTVTAKTVDAAGKVANDTHRVRVVESRSGNQTDGDVGGATAPVARVDVNRTRVRPEGAVEFDGRRSADEDGEIETYRWDLDGDGQFDDATGGVVVERLESTTTVGLLVVDDEGHQDATVVQVQVGETAGDAGRGEPVFDFVELVGAMTHVQVASEHQSESHQLHYTICLGRRADQQDEEFEDSDCRRPPTVTQESITIRWERRPGTMAEKMVSGPGVSLRFDLAGRQVATDRKISVIYEGPRALDGRIADSDTLSLCTIPRNPAEADQFPDWCEINFEDERADPIAVDVDGPTGQVAAGTTLTHDATVEHRGQYERLSVSWTVEGLSGFGVTGDGEQFSWTATNDQDYAIGLEVVATATAQRTLKGENVTSTAREVIRVQVCPEGTTPTDGKCSSERSTTDGGDKRGGNITIGPSCTPDEPCVTDSGTETARPAGSVVVSTPARTSLSRD